MVVDIGNPEVITCVHASTSDALGQAGDWFERDASVAKVRVETIPRTRSEVDDR